MGRKPDIKARERLLTEAEHIIHLKGCRASSLDEIAQACGTSKANLLHHFGSKAGLAMAVLDLKIEDFRACRVLPLCDEEDPEAAVERLFLDAARFFTGNGCKAGCLIGNMALEMSDADEAFRDRVGRFFAEWAGQMADCLERRKARGYFADTLDSRAAAEAVVSLYEGAIMQARVRRDPAIFRRVGAVARSVLEQHKRRARRHKTMGPKTPCGC